MGGHLGHQSGVQAAMSNRYCLVLRSMWIGHHSFQDRLGDNNFWADEEVCLGRSKPFAVDHGGGGCGGCFPASDNELDIFSSTTSPLEDCETLRHNVAGKSPHSSYSSNHLPVLHCGPTPLKVLEVGFGGSPSLHDLTECHLGSRQCSWHIP